MEKTLVEPDHAGEWQGMGFSTLQEKACVKEKRERNESVKGTLWASVPPRPGQIHLWMETFRFSDLAFCRTAGMMLSAALG